MKWESKHRGLLLVLSGIALMRILGYVDRIDVLIAFAIVGAIVLIDIWAIVDENQK